MIFFGGGIIAKINNHDAKRSRETAGIKPSARIKNWDIVKLKPDFYLGKKIKFNMKYLDISSDGEKIITSEILIPGSPFDKKLIDKILTLKKYSTYTFFGKVINIEYFGTGLYIESIK